MSILVLSTPYHKAATCKNTGKIITVGALLVNELGHLLAMQSVDEKFVGMMGIPRGKVHVGESTGKALEREIYEETGKNIYTRRRLLTTATDTHIHYDHIAQVRGYNVKLSKEHSNSVWVESLDEWPGPKEPLFEQLVTQKRPEIEAFVKKIVRQSILENAHKFN